MSDDAEKRELTVAEAGRLGGLKNAATHGREHFQRIGREGGRKVRELVAKGRAAEAREKQ